MVRKKRAPECVGTLCGPQISQCNKSNGACVDIELKGNGSRVCLAMGQILQLSSKEIFFEVRNGVTKKTTDDQVAYATNWWGVKLDLRWVCSVMETCSRDHHVVYLSQLSSP